MVGWDHLDFVRDFNYCAERDFKLINDLPCFLSEFTAEFLFIVVEELLGHRNTQYPSRR